MQEAPKTPETNPTPEPVTPVQPVPESTQPPVPETAAQPVPIQPASIEVAPPTPAVAPSAFTMKDFLIPVSIVVAGLFVGGGLYFSGGQAPTTPTNPAPVVGQTVKKTLPELAVAAGVKQSDFQQCLENGDTLSIVNDHMQNAFETGGKGTPWSILIGPSGKKYPINGAVPQQTVEQLIALAKSEAAMGPGTSEQELAFEKILPLSEADHIKGSLDAQIKIVEYSDFDCPFCSRFHATMNTIVEKYDGSEVAWVYRHLPLEQLHPNAPAIAVASECVAKFGGNEAFWKFADGYLAGS